MKTRPPVQQTAIHSSGRFDRPISAVTRANRRLRKRGSIITATEVSARTISEVNAAWSAPGWAYAWIRQGSAGERECLASWDTSVWRLVGAPRSEKLTDQTFTRSKAYGGRTADYTRALVVTLEMVDRPHRRPVTLVVTHMPLDNTPKRAAIWLDCAAGLRSLVREIRATTQGDVLLAADWNRSWRRPDDRALLEREIARPLGLRQCWDLHQPRSGTHGRSLIDGTITDLPMAEPFLLPDDPSSDHRPYGVPFRVRFKPVRRK